MTEFSLFLCTLLFIIGTGGSVAVIWWERQSRKSEHTK